MGEFKFRVPTDWQLEPRLLRTVHVIGLDGIPGACRVRTENQLLIVNRNQNESGRLYIAYPFVRCGELTVCTGTLPESDQPYELLTELARGTLNRLRNQTAIWQEGGLTIPATIADLIIQSTAALGQAITGEPSQRETAARQSLDLAMEAIFDLCDQFGREISAYRVNQSQIPAFWQAANCSDTSDADSRELNRSFDFIETVSGNGSIDDNRKSILGPLLDASPSGSFSAGDHDFKSRREALLARCRCDLQQLSASTSMIHAACGLNGIGHQRLSYRQQMQLTSEILELINDLGLSQPVMVSFENPWAERLAWSVGGIHPLQIADELMRTGVSISCLGLDVNLDYWPNGSLSRDPLQWIDMFDIWCQFGLPLVLCFRIPQPVDNAACSDGGQSAPARGGRNGRDESGPAVVNSIRDTLSSGQRLELIRTVLPMAVARPALHGIIWRQWSDADDARFPHAGMVDASGGVKPIGEIVKQLKQTVLMR